MSFVISLTSITRAILIWFNVCGVIWRRSATKDRKKAGRRGLSLPASLYMMRGSPLDRRAVKMIYAVFDHRPARQHTLLRRLVHDRDRAFEDNALSELDVALNREIGAANQR